MAASSATPPSSATSPQILAPASSSSTNKASMHSPNQVQTPSIFTNKQWVIPPRPKPGRKPAADTPPTKRKAQNRAAQRAFRERRAARVGELEEQMQQIEDENGKECESLHSRIQQLEAEVDRCSRLVVSWSTKYQEIVGELSSERRLREEAEGRVKPAGDTIYGDDVVPLRPKNDRQKPIPETAPLSIEATVASQDDALIGCGKCTIDTHCECIERAFGLSDMQDGSPTFKRPHSPSSGVESKRNRHSLAADHKPEEEESEIDFTEQFSTKRVPTLTSTSSNSLTATTTLDSCGFCQDGTACICAEMAAEEKRSNDNPDGLTIQSTVKMFKPSENPCTNGPGSCQQCQSDSNSTFFCKSLAASRNKLRGQPPPAQPSDANTPQTTSMCQEPREQAITGISLSCADAYATLSRHPAYERASEDPGSWLPKLATIPGGAERPAFEVEAASVMQTLRFFDRRFGREA